MDSWVSEHKEDSLQAAIRTSNYPIFRALLDSGYDISSADYIYSRDGSFDTLPIHVAAAHSDPRFLRDLLDHFANPDDPCQLDYPSFDNTFRAAVRAGRWENADLIIDKGGANGWAGAEASWELWTRCVRVLCESEETEERMAAFVASVFRLHWDALYRLELPSFLKQGRRDERRPLFDSLPGVPDEFELFQPLSNLEWILSVHLPHLSLGTRSNIVQKLVQNGSLIAYSRSTSAVQAWNLRADALQAVDADAIAYSSPLDSLPPSYHALTTPLHLCVRNVLPSILQYLISKVSLNPNIPEFTTRALSPLLLAISLGHLDLAQLLTKLGARIDYVTPVLHLTAVHYAAATRSVPMLNWVVRQLQDGLDAGAAHKVFKLQSILGHTALHVACMPTQSLTNPSGRERSFYAVPGASGSPATGIIRTLLCVGAGDWIVPDHLGLSAADYLMASIELYGDSVDDGMRSIVDEACRLTGRNKEM